MVLRPNIKSLQINLASIHSENKQERSNSIIFHQENRTSGKWITQGFTSCKS